MTVSAPLILESESVLSAAPTATAPHENTFHIVGVGASAGGLEAFTQLLKSLPDDTGMAFVLVQHLAPTHASSLADILSRATNMPVAEVEDGMRVEPNRIYVIPPDRDMTIRHGVLHLLPRAAHGQHWSIDNFFRTLAEDQGHRAIGVVLSGTGTDGTLGLEAIKSGGGITFAQDSTAQQDGMPRSAIAAGYADSVLPPSEIANEIGRLSRHPYTAPIPFPIALGAEMNLVPILKLLHEATDTDFTNYKTNTLYRRITRRMALHKIEGTTDYLNFLKETPAEVEKLYQDILINVTSFFRNPETFEFLENKILPKLMKDRSADDPLRIWVIGCSTGEEAYSLAMIFTEAADDLNSHVQLQLFATDINPSAIEKARTGLYPKTIAQNVSPERLRRFFEEAGDGYRISKSIREQCVFSCHNVLTNPPFSRMDVISCRNLLIYMEPVLQQRIMPILHYALKPSGCLWLGASETIGSYRNLFETEDSKHKLYVKKIHPSSTLQFFPKVGKMRKPELGYVPILPRVVAVDLQKQADRVLLTKYAPPSVLVSSSMEILQFRGDTSPYLTPAPGKASFNLLKMLREGLLVAIRSAVTKAAKERVTVREKGLRVKSTEGYLDVGIEVIPMKDSANEGGFLILFEDIISSPPSSAPSAEISYDAKNEAVVVHMEPEVITRLTQELSDTRDYLQSVIDQQEIANEELQSAHEELQSTNEELQSMNEELETSKEEIQSSNEELVTLNDELNNRNQEMNRVNNDIVNLLGSAQLAIIMLTSEFRIRRFTPWAESLLNLIPSDVGRSFCDTMLNFPIPDLETLLKEVQKTGNIKEMEIQNKEGHWYSLRLRPYMTLENTIDGVIVMLVDVHTLKRANEYMESIVSTVREPLLVLDANLHVRTASRSFWQSFELVPSESKDLFLFEVGNGQWDIPELRKALTEVLPHDGAFDNLEIEHTFKHIGHKILLFTGRRLIQLDDRSPAILLAIEDITQRKQLEETLRHRATTLTEADDRKTEFLATLAHELRNPLAPLRNGLQILSMPNASQDMIVQSRKLMERQLKQMVRLIDDLLDVSRITSGKIDLRLAYLVLADVVKNAMETSASLIEERNHTLTVDLPEESIWLHGDMTRLSQILSNLLNNSAKYTNPGGHIELIVRQKENDAVIIVRDDGIGIAPEMLPRIFDMFAQVDTSLERRQGGMGIGLSLVRNLVKMHNGSVEAYSEGLGKGSEFTVRLPVSSPPQSKPALPLTSKQEDNSASPCRVLVVDDNESSSKTLGWMIELMGHEVRLAKNGLSAIKIAKSFRPDVVLLDIGLPGMNGYEICKLMRKEPALKDTIFIAQTGWGQEEHIRRSKKAGFGHHLVKPVDMDDLKKILSSKPVREQSSHP